ncbi:hypothetical protein, partial [Azotobacter chroococcum]
QQGAAVGEFGDCQFTCFPDCQSSLSQDSAKNHEKGGFTALFHGCQERVVRDVGNIDQLNSPAIFDG